MDPNEAVPSLMVIKALSIFAMEHSVMIGQAEGIESMTKDPKKEPN